MAVYSLVGTAVNVLVIAGMVAYTVLAVGHVHGAWTLSLFGDNWAKDGFCLSSFQSAPLFHSHLLCFYGDTLFALLFILLGKFATQRSELQVVNKNTASIFFHGVVHAMLWYLVKLEEEEKELEEEENKAAVRYRLIAIAGSFVFFFSFIHLMTRSSLWVSLLQTAFHAVAITYVPRVLAFTYANGVIVSNLTVSKILSNPHDVFYMLEAVVVSLPIMTVAFLEPIFCDDFLIRWGGHVFFDMSIPVSILIYVAIATQLEPRDIAKKSK